MSVIDIHNNMATPPPAPLAMPIQSLKKAPKATFDWPSARTMLARLVAFGGAILLTYYGYVQMNLVFGNETQTVLQEVLLVLFVTTFGWISFSTTQTLAGLFNIRASQNELDEVDQRRANLGRTVLLMPVYNEDPAATCAALQAMGEELAEAGHGQDFEIFIASDTRDPEAWLRETLAYAELKQALRNKVAVWYRRRKHNTGRKAGNLHEFIERWGARYDHMLVLDADSVMSGDTIIRMTARMAAEPKLGILQTLPILAGGNTLFARLQQFAGRLYGPVIANGVAAWQGKDGNYWGHNAMIRVKAFAENCGLPTLPGRMPFGGHVMSHDFVEAALIRRGGWQVRMDTDLGGSWEGSPPSLIDLAIRDRRWAQGNLQHSKIIGARGLRWPSRVHFFVGIGSYLMSPIWLAMLLVGFTLTLQTLIIQPNYFEDGLQLFPNWPVFDAERMIGLFSLSIFMLLLPKLVGMVAALIRPAMRRKFGGGIRIIASTVLEIILSALYAPILMMIQVWQVVQIFAGFDSGWATQTREGAVMSWGEAFRRHRRHVLMGLIPGIMLAWLAPNQLVWLSPVLVGLLLSPWLSRISGCQWTGNILSRTGLLKTPEEIAEPPTFTRMDALVDNYRGGSSAGLLALFDNPAVLTSHCASLQPDDGEDEQAFLDKVTARAKLEAAPTPEAALKWMNKNELTALVAAANELVPAYKPKAERQQKEG